MGMNISNADILALLPLFMRGDETNAALSRAVNKLIRELGSRIKQLRVWDQIENLDHADLDELAWELNVDWYETGMSLEAKRQTIKYAQQIQAKRGTKWAVEHLISAYFGCGYVAEWFETGGEPYTFSAEITNSDLRDLSVKQFVEAVNAAKSVRSHLVSIGLPLIIFTNRNVFSFLDLKIGFRLRNRGTLHFSGFVFDSRIINSFPSMNAQRISMTGYAVKNRFNLTGTVAKTAPGKLNGSFKLDGSQKLNGKYIISQEDL